jgi:hypothetical protein
MIRPTVTASTQGHMISDSRGGGASSGSTGGGASTVPREDIGATAPPLGEGGDDHADIGMDLSSGEEEEEVSSSTPKDQFSSVTSPYASNPRRCSTSFTSARQHNPPQQQQHVTDDSEASSVPEYTKKKRRRPFESTCTTPSPSHSCPSPHPIQSQQQLDTHRHSNCADRDPVAVSRGSPEDESNSIALARHQPPASPPPPRGDTTEPDETQQEQQQLHKQEGNSYPSTSAVPIETLPQHQQIREVAPLDISYRYTPASIKLKESLVSRLSLACPTGRIQVVSSLRECLVGKVG